MQLIPNWREVLTKAWSVRLIVVAAVLTGLEAIAPSLSLPPVVLFGVVVAAFVARLLAQE